MASETITPEMTVREVLQAYPKTRAVFNRHGLMGCGGRLGPIEPIGWFAQVHHVDPEELLMELNRCIREQEDASASTEGKDQVAEEGNELYRKFLKTAIILTLTLGATMGAMSLSRIAFSRSLEPGSILWWPSHIQVHGHAQIFGWVGLFIMGVAYHVLPRLKGKSLPHPGLAEASFWLVLVGLLLRVISQPAFVAFPGLGEWVTVSGVLELMGVSFFAWIIWKLVLGPEPLNLYEKFLLAGTIWFWAQTAVGLALIQGMRAWTQNYIPKALDVPYLHLQVWGFIIFWILGISLRTLPVFMGLKQPKTSWVAFSFWALNLGVLLNAGAQFANWAYPASLWPEVRGFGAALELLAAFAFVAGIHLFEKPAMNIEEAGVDRRYESFVRIAYVWFMVAAMMGSGYAIYEALTGDTVGHALVGAYRHAVTVGFITMMIIGMSARIVPVFKGVPLHSGRMLKGTFYLLNIGNFCRVFFQASIPVFGLFSYALMGMSGWMEVTALTLFGINLWKTMNKPAEEGPAIEGDLEITPETKVGDILECYPATLEVFLDYGFSQLKNPIMRSTIAKRASLGIVCQMRGLDIEEVISDLKKAIHSRHRNAEFRA